MKIYDVKEFSNNSSLNTKGLKNDNDKLPLGIVIQKQFPNALKAIAQCSLYGHNKYKDVDNDWLNYQRLENANQRYSDAMIRHYLAESEDLDDSGLEHIVHTCWNALA